MTQFQHTFEEFPNPLLVWDGFDTFVGLKPWFLKPVTQTILPNLVMRNDPIPGKENGKNEQNSSVTKGYKSGIHIKLVGFLSNPYFFTWRKNEFSGSAQFNHFKTKVV